MADLQLYFHTLKHLRRKQLFYQLWYKLKPYWPFKSNYKEFADQRLHRLQFGQSGLILSHGKYLGDHSFSFLNRTHRFAAEIDWNFTGYGKLWNYNLQYFDYLSDDSHPVDERCRLIESCCETLKAGTLSLEPYPVSLRLLNWILFYAQTGYASPSFLDAIRMQTAYLKSNQEYHILANHYLENIITLTVAGYALRSEALVRYSIDKLRQELEEQILPDGAHYECSPMYHCILLSRLLLLLDIAMRNEHPQTDYAFIREAAANMGGWLKQVCFANGDYPMFNDSAPGIAVRPSMLFNIMHQMGISPQIRPLGRSGYRRMEGEHFELLADVGNILPEYQPGHAHSDMLSFCLNVQQQPVFIDPGVSTYQPSARRSFERSTACHNTVTVNNTSQSQLWGSFRVGQRAHLNIINDEDAIIEASHDGYLRSAGVLHTRQFRTTSREITITDRISGGKAKTTNIARFYLDPGMEVRRLADGSFDLAGIVSVCFTGGEPALQQVELPAGFNQLKSSLMLEVSFQNLLTTVITVK